ncbi:hypothetical protein [Amycolatopsis kentuckyensis]|uniref:hypothetical protein n=1 Tax=Amycolatopsis kentuckyensis TaxID=218823 RepID=UPI000A3667EC|nr:hypothetical protein [Amycolatopsis kentuckyensis]
MTDARISISSTGAEEWRRLSRNLRGAPKQLRADLRKRILEAGRPILDDVKQAVRNIPVTSSRGGGATRRRQFNAFRAEQVARRSGRDVEQAINRGLRKQAGLRRHVADATKLQIRATGIRFVVDSSNLPAGQRTMPRHLDSPKGWRHPVFGNRDNWVHQQGKPYFGTTIKRRSNDFRRAILQAMDDTANKIQN